MSTLTLKDIKMIYGYARVSTQHQDTTLQLIALQAAGCDEIREEKASGRSRNRPVLKKLLTDLQSGDELVLWKIDRMGRNVLHALTWLAELQDKNVNLRSITDAIDMRTASGRYSFRNILNAAQYESDVNSERTLAGLAAARAQGRVGGRKPTMTEPVLEKARDLINAGNNYREVAEVIGVTTKTIYKYFPVNS
jgi:DNA invertase Pin-like site-specific DNA recombinase